ncbi:MAG: MBL fold metallo-hydrolase [Candidatus Shapirobacteria bacterium]|nr:MBL fold metallo-hydrolase [Candidatus Shapirobacteria bacterium]
MKIEKLIVGQLQTNCYLVWDEISKEGVIIDPGDDGEYIINRIKDLEIKPQMILATHGHFDHLLAVLELKLAFKIPFLLQEKDLFLAKKAVSSAHFFTGDREALPVLVDKFIKEGDIIKFGAAKQTSQLKVLETPGHSPGGVSFYGRGVLFHKKQACLFLKKQACLFSGDTLFAQSIGRTDFSYCSHQDLINSIKNKLFNLPNETIVYPGHGEETTIGLEKKFFNSNQF